MAHRKVFGIRNLTIMAVLIAMQIILARFVGLQINEGLRVSFEGIPVILAGFWLGPISGMLVAVVADVLGTIISGYGVYFPLLTVGPMLLGMFTGFGGRLLPKDGAWEKKHVICFFALVIAAECITNIFYGTWALSLYYRFIVEIEMPFAVLFATRIPTKLVTMTVDVSLSYVICRTVYQSVVRKMQRRGSAYDRKRREEDA